LSLHINWQAEDHQSAAMKWIWALFLLCALAARPVSAQHFSALMQNLYGRNSHYAGGFIAVAHNASAQPVQV
jgi:hypothetical protein